nr:Uncharacterised protein [Klebsiella pneumoniae]
MAVKLSPTPRNTRPASSAAMASIGVACRTTASSVKAPLSRQQTIPRLTTFSAPDIGIAPGVRPAYQRRYVLQTDHNSGDKGAVAQLIVNIARQYGQRQTNGEIADTGKTTIEIMRKLSCVVLTEVLIGIRG